MNSNIKKVFKEENLILPDYNKHLNIIDLMKTIFNRYGTEFKTNHNMNYLNSIIPQTKHTLLIIIDGMGSNLVDSLGEDSILKKSKKENLLTVSPSTTGCVLTSIATSTFPSEHGIIGWYSHHKKFDIDYYPILFIDRKNETPLFNYNINSEDIFKIKSKFNNLTINTYVLYPDYICNSVYSKFVANDEIRIGYKDYNDIKMKFNELISLNEETFTYLYLPEIDNLEHDNGVYSKIVKKQLLLIENMIKEILKNKDLTIIITADHGQINIKQDIIMDFEKYNNYFYGMPGIDFATATFYVKKGKEKKFEEEFYKDFKDKMFLFKTEEILKNNIFGVGTISENLKENLGEYIGICKNHYCFVNSEDIDTYIGKTAGNHSGFSKEEMIIPLIIMNNNASKQ